MALNRTNVAVVTYVKLCQLLTQTPNQISCNELQECFEQFHRLMTCTWCKRILVLPIKSKLCGHYVCSHCKWNGKNRTALCHGCTNRERFETSMDEECRGILKCFNCMITYLITVVEDLSGCKKNKCELMQLLHQAQQDFRCEDEAFHDVNNVDEDANKKRKRRDTDFLNDALSVKEKIDLTVLD